MAETPMMRIEFTIAGIEQLRVRETPLLKEGIVGVMTVRSIEGERMNIGITIAAMEELCRALIDNSPRTPGTPGRN